MFYPNLIPAIQEYVAAPDRNMEIDRRHADDLVSALLTAADEVVNQALDFVDTCANESAKDDDPHIQAQALDVHYAVVDLRDMLVIARCKREGDYF
jgi:hypothetical protein